MRLCPIMIVHSHRGWIVAKRSLQITCSLELPPPPGPVFRPPALDPISGRHTCLRPKFRELGPVIAAQIRPPSNPHGFSQGFLCRLPFLPFPLPSPSPMHTPGTPTEDLNGAPPTMHMILERTEDQGLATQNHCV